MFSFGYLLFPNKFWHYRFNIFSPKIGSYLLNSGIHCRFYCIMLTIFWNVNQFTTENKCINSMEICIFLQNHRKKHRSESKRSCSQQIEVIRDRNSKEKKKRGRQEKKKRTEWTEKIRCYKKIFRVHRSFLENKFVFLESDNKMEEKGFCF